MELNREKLKRMFEDTNGNGGSANSGGGGGSLAGYATQAWVNEGFVSIEFFNRLFTVYGPGETSSDPDVVIEPNDLDSTIKNIKAMFGLWTEQYLSALGLNPGGTGSATSLGMLDDVNITTPTNGQALVYNSTSQKWENQTISTVTALANLTDVLLTSPANGQTLLYDGTNAKWYNSALKTINGQSLIGSGDISVGGGASGNYLPLSGGTLTNSTTSPILTINNNASYGSWITFQHHGTSKGSVAWYDGMAGVANEVYRYYRIGVTDSGVPVYRQGARASDDTFELLHTGNWTSFINPYYSTRSPGYEVALSSGKWSWIRFRSGSLYWDTAVNDTASQYRDIGVGGFGIRQNGADNNGLYIRYNTSSYGKLVVAVPSGECSLGFAVNGTNVWTIGYTGSNNEFGWFYSTNGGWKMTLNSSGSLYCVGGVTALSDIRYKNIQEYVSLDVQSVANAPAVRFTWKDGKDKAIHIGSIAQYWEKILPESVTRTSEGRLSMQYGVVALVAAISTAKKVQEHERRIAELERENHRLKEMLNIA